MKKMHVKRDKEHHVYFTSDLHFGHRNIISFCYRPFLDTKDMDTRLIENWNEVVSNDDTVFVLGDICWFHGRHDLKNTLKQLYGKDIYVILGNHDKEESFDLLLQDHPNWHVLGDAATLFIDEEGKNATELFLCHYPLMTWPHRGFGAINLFGHIHSYPGFENMDSKLPLWPNQYDVGVDNNQYKPIEFGEITEKLNNRIYTEIQ